MGLHFAALFGPLLAQTAPRPAASTPGKDEEAVLELSPFVISSRTEDEERVTESTSGTLVSRPLDKLPMGIEVVSAELMRQLDILNADSLNRVVPGLANQNEATSEGLGNNTQYASRGFTVLPRRNGFAPGGRLYDMTGIDRVEVIRGPNSLLYGQSDAGGIINFISKRPRIRNVAGVKGFVSGAAGNDDFYRSVLDVDYTMIPGRLGFRLPASFTNTKREFNFFRNKTISYNPSILFRPFANTEIVFEYEYLDIRTNVGTFQPLSWVPPGQTLEVVDKDSRGLGRAARGGFAGPYAKSENEQINWTLDLTSRLTDHITFRGIYSKNRRDRNTLQPTGGDPFRAVPTAYYGGNTRDGNRVDGWKADLLGEWDIGDFKTRTVVGFEYNENVFLNTIWRGWNAATNRRDNLFTLNLGYDAATGRVTRAPTAADYRPFNGVTGEWLDTRLDPAFWRIEVGPNSNRSEWTNLRVSEVLSGFDDRLQILGGVARGESTLTNTTTGVEDARKKTVFQVGVGYSFDAKKQHMVFANRSTSYRPQFLFDINSNPVAPVTADGVEAGLKSTWGETGLSTTLTVYAQERENVGRTLTDNTLNPPRTYAILTPGEEVKGVEFEASYRYDRQLSFTFLYAQFSGEITGSPPGREFLIGRELPRAPERAANLIVNYRLAGDGWLRNTRFTLGANWKNDTWLDVSQAQNTLAQRSDGGAVLFAVVAREFKLANRRAIAVRLNVGNLLDRDYVTEGFTYGQERTWRLSTDFKF